MVFTQDEFEEIKRVLNIKEELKGWSLNSNPKYYGDCIVLIYNNANINLPVILSRRKENAERIAGTIANEFHTANEVLIATPDGKISHYATNFKRKIINKLW